MSVSWVDIANRALNRLNTDTIGSLTEGTQNASLANEFIYDERDSILEAGEFSCSRARADLNQLTATPTSEWTHEYQLPNDCLKVLQTYPDTDYSIEGGILFSDASSCSIRYIKQVTDPNKLPTLLRRAIAAALASTLAIPLAKSIAEQQRLQQEALYWFSRARAQDNRYGRGKAQTADPWWNDIRQDSSEDDS